jgi:hypothetical protein
VPNESPEAGTPHLHRLRHCIMRQEHLVDLRTISRLHVSVKVKPLFSKATRARDDIV